MSPVNSMFVCIKNKIKNKKLSANLFLKWPISIIGKMLNIGADNRSTPNFEPIYVSGVKMKMNAKINNNKSSDKKTFFKCF